MRLAGVPSSQAQTVALMQIYNWVQTQGFMVGMDDVFMVTTVLAAIALIFTFLFSSAKERELRHNQ